MAAVACIMLLLSCSIAGQAITTLSLATTQVARPAGIHSTAGPDDLLFKRTSNASSPPRRWRAPLQRTDLHGPGLEPAPPIHTFTGASPATHAHGDDLRHWAALSMPHMPGDGPSAPRSELGGSSKQPDKTTRRPHKSLTNNPNLQAQARQEYRDRLMDKIKKGELINRTKPGGGKYRITTIDEYHASQRAKSRQTWSNLTPEGKAKKNEERRKNRGLAEAKRKAQREAQQEGRTWQGSPVRKPGRPRRNWDKEQKQAQVGAEESRQHAPILSTMEGGGSTQHPPPGVHDSGTLRLRTPASSLGSSTVAHAPLPESASRRFAPGPSSPEFHLDLSLSAPGSSSSGQRQATRAPQPAALPPASTLEERRLGLFLAPPGQHDRLQLSPAPPRYD